MTIEEAYVLAKATLSAKRYSHSENVATSAMFLAKKYGANIEEARLAGILHDLLKEKSKEEMLHIATGNDILLKYIKKRPFAVWHGPVAAIFIEQQHGIKDKNVLSAIACHTTGKENMKLMDKIIYIADLISEDRTYHGVAAIREEADQNLNCAVKKAIGEQIDLLRRCGKVPLPEQVEAFKSI